jgi:predicted Zn-dependent protease
MRRRRSTLAALLAVALALAGAARALGAGGEAELGRRFFLAARSELPLVQDPAVTDYVQHIGARLVKTLGVQEFEYRFYVVQSPVLNAFAVPGGYVFIFSGLLARVSNDDELAGVLGHEMGHVSGHHIVRQQEQGQVWNAAALLGVLLSAVNPVAGAAGLAAAQTAQLKFSREFEQEADYLGLRYSSQAGYDPHAMGTFFKTLLSEQRINPAGVPAYMLTHPLTEDRVAHVETTIVSQKLKTPAGRPASANELGEAQAVARAIADPPDLVVARYRRLADEKPDDAERQLLLGRVYQTIGQLDAARTALEKCRDLGGVGGRVDRPLGTVYAALNDPTRAREALERHLTKHPDDAFAHTQLGKALTDAGDTGTAFTEFQRALSLDPDQEDAQRLLGIALGRNGNEAEGFYHLALASRLRGELEQALNQFRQTDRLITPGSARQMEVEQAIAELEPLVRERERDRQERRRTGRRGLGARETTTFPPARHAW